MKIIKFIAVLILLTWLPVQANRVRVSIMFVHYSVGNQIIYGGYCAGGYDRPLQATLDTLSESIVVGNDTARIVFRDYQLNLWNSGPLSDTLVDCDSEDRFSGFSYDLRSPSYDRTKIWNSWNGETNQFAGFLEDFFNVPGKETSTFWQMFYDHNVPGSSGDSVLENYDLIMIKNPFICWSFMTQAQADSIQKFYEAVRDSAVNHPETEICLVFGTPRVIGDLGMDSIQANITYQLATWFDSDNFFTHGNVGTYKNLWRYDSYRFMCETSPDSVNRYCLKNSYAAVPGADSHLSFEGSRVAQDSLIAFIGKAAEDILIIKSGIITRVEIDKTIKAFRSGQATLQEVLDLIDQYNNQ